MAPTVLKAKGRRDKSNWMGIRKDVLRSDEYAELAPTAVKLLVDLLVQYNGFNNGDLCGAWSIMSKRGWHSKATLHRATRELIDKRWIVISRQGGRNKCSLFAVTFESIDDCKGKLDIAPTTTPSYAWKINSGTPHVGQLTPYLYQSRK